MIKQYLDRGIDMVQAVILAAMTVIVFLQVFFRYVLNHPLSWPEETARMMIVWLSFLGAYMAMREKKHIGFNLLVKKLPLRTQAIINIVGKTLIVVFLLVVIKQGYFFAQKFLTMQMPYTGVSVGWFVYSVFPVSGIFMLFQAVSDLSQSVTLLQHGEKPKDAGGN
jgi:TRAP-type C4-dicarboxylate transport system permease small subunit